MFLLLFLVPTAAAVAVSINRVTTHAQPTKSTMMMMAVNGEEFVHQRLSNRHRATSIRYGIKRTCPKEKVREKGFTRALQVKPALGFVYQEQHISPLQHDTPTLRTFCQCNLVRCGSGWTSDSSPGFSSSPCTKRRDYIGSLCL